MLPVIIWPICSPNRLAMGARTRIGLAERMKAALSGCPDRLLSDAEGAIAAVKKQAFHAKLDGIADTRGPFQGSAMAPKKLCHCSELEDLAIIGMGDANGLDEEVFATLDLVQNHGGEQWWLYADMQRVPPELDDRSRRTYP